MLLFSFCFLLVKGRKLLWRYFSAGFLGIDSVFSTCVSALILTAFTHQACAQQACPQRAYPQGACAQRFFTYGASSQLAPAQPAPARRVLLQLASATSPFPQQAAWVIPPKATTDRALATNFTKPCPEVPAGASAGPSQANGLQLASAPHPFPQQAARVLPQETAARRALAAHFAKLRPAVPGRSPTSPSPGAVLRASLASEAASSQNLLRQSLAKDSISDAKAAEGQVIELALAPRLLAQNTPDASALNNNKLLPFSLKKYQIKQGDSLANLGRKYNLSLKGILYLNQESKLNSSPSQPLKPGLMINLPKKPLTASQSQALARLIRQKDSGNIGFAVNNNVNNKAAPAPQIAANSNKSEQQSLAQLQNKFANKAIAQASAQLSQWANHYASLQLKLHLLDGFRFASSAFDILIPLYDKQDFLLFNQSSLAFDSEGGRLNLGFGGRYFWPASMLGLNGFLDYDLKGGNLRLGLGAEYARDYLRMAFNSYFALSSWRTSLLVKNNQNYQERAAGGFDINITGFLPFYPQIGLNALIEKYFGQNIAFYSKDSLVKDPLGIKLGISYSPIALLSFDFAYKQQQSFKGAEIGAKIRYHLGVPLAAQLSSAHIDQLRSAKAARYDFVARNNNIILAYKKNEPLALAKISGFAGQEEPLVKYCNLGANWQIKAWDNPDKLSLSQECNNKFKLKDCKVKLPPYNSAQASLNNHPLALILHNKKNAKELIYNTIIETKCRDKAARFDIAFRKVQDLTAAPFSEIPLFSKAEIGELWQIKAWQVKKALDAPAQSPAYNSIWQDVPDAAKGLLSKACFARENLYGCRLILPPALNEKLAYYDLRLVFRHKESGYERQIATKFAVDGQKIYLIANNPIREKEASSVKLFHKIAVSDFWKETEWLLPKDFTQNGGKLSPECSDSSRLSQCKVILPNYHRLHRGEEDSNNYKISLELAHNDGAPVNGAHKEHQHITAASWDINVRPRYEHIELSLKAAKTEVTYGETLPITINLSEYGQPIDIAPHDIERYFSLDLYEAPYFKHEKPNRHDNNHGPQKDDKKEREAFKLLARALNQKTSLASVSRISRQAPGIYQFNLIAGQKTENLEIRLAYGEKISRTLHIKVRPGIDFAKLHFASERDILLLSSLGGKDSKISYYAYDQAHQPIAPSHLVLKLQDSQGKNSPRAASFSERKENGPLNEVLLSALMPGEYRLGLYYVDQGIEQLLAQEKLYFIDGQPSYKSKYRFIPDFIALDDSAGFPSRTSLIFEAFDKYGHVINYDEITKNEALNDVIGKIEPVFFNHDKKRLSHGGLKFRYEGSNRFIFKASGLDFSQDFFAEQYVGSFYARINYDHKELPIEAQLRTNAFYIVPDYCHIYEPAQSLSLREAEHITINYEFDKYSYAILVDKAPIEFRVTKLLDNGQEVELPVQISKYVNKVISQISFALDQPGHYRVRAYYKTFHHPPKEITIQHSCAEIEIHD